MSSHIAVVSAPYDRLILDGRKVIEARLTITPKEPFGAIAPGDRIHLKRSGGPFFAIATAARVLMVDALTPKAIDQLRKQYDRWICADPNYWKAKQQAKFATLIWLRDVQTSTLRPRYKPQNMRAWYVLESSDDPPVTPARAERPPRESFDIELTAGAIRQNYVRVGDHASSFGDGQFELRLVDGPAVKTDLSRGMVRWRGWGPWFAEHQLQAGDRLQFTSVDGRTYRVKPLRS